MSPRSKPIPQSQWNYYKPTILELRREGLPLQSKQGARNLIQVLKDEHGFTASLAQYEAQLRKWNTPRNLTKHEWRSILAKQRQLEARGLRTQVKLSGQAISQDRIKRAKRHAEDEAFSAVQPLGLRQNIFGERSSVVTIEIRQPGGQWSIYDGKDSSPGPDMPEPSTDDDVDEDTRVPSNLLFPGCEVIAASADHELPTLFNEVTPAKDIAYQTTHVSSDRPTLQNADSSRGPVELAANSHEYNGDSLSVGQHRHRPQPICSQPLDLFLPGSSGNITSHEASSINPSMTLTLNDKNATLIPASPLTATRSTSQQLAPSAFATASMHSGCPSISSSQLYLSDSSEVTEFPNGISPALPFRLSPPPNLVNFDFNSNWFEWLIASGSQEMMDASIMNPQKVTRTKSRGSFPFSVQPPGGDTEPHLAWDIIRNSVSIEPEPGRLTKSQKIPALEEVLDSVQSLLPMSTPEDEFGESLRIFNVDGVFTDSFVSKLLFSFVNNFAGLEEVPAKPIIKFIGQNEIMRSSILKYLRHAPPSLSSAVAEVLFKAAIDADVLQIVLSVLESGLVNPDTIVFGFGDDRQTAVERAVYLQELDITECLLEAGADVNKTYASENMYPRQGPLHWAFHYEDKVRCVDPCLVRAILDHGAVVRARIVDTALRWGDESVITEVMSKLPPAEHVHCFEECVLVNAVQSLRNDTSFKVARQLVHACQDMHDGRCMMRTMDVTTSEPTQSGHALYYAAKRGHFELVQLLIPHVDQAALNSALPAAVKSESRDTVNLLLDHGAKVDATLMPIEIYCSDDRVFQSEDNVYITTALAEALRAGDNELILRFEQMGALAEINKPVFVQWRVTRGSEGNDYQVTHLEASLQAVSEAGHMTYLRRLLKLTPKPYSRPLDFPLATAIMAKHENIAWAILAHGVLVKGNILGPVVQFASRPLVSAVLDCVVNQADTVPKSYQAGAGAAHRGDVSIVADLDFLGIDINSRYDDKQHERTYPTMLTIAIREGHKPLIKRLIELGADPSMEARLGNTALAAAVGCKDKSLVENLLEHGADPADSDALKMAVSLQCNEILGVLLQKFRTRYPRGLPFFGGDVLLSALEIGNDINLDQCLGARFGTNSFFVLEDNGAMTPLGFIIRRYGDTRLDWVSKLIEAGADINAKVNTESARWRRHLRSSDGQTALLEAIETRSLSLVQMLINRGADVNKAPRLGLKHTPLQKACDIGSYPIVCVLLDLGAEVNAEPAHRQGGTALQFAAKSGSLRIAELLLSRGAFVNAPSSRVGGHSALEYATKYGRISMIEMLCNVPGPAITMEQYESAISLAQDTGHIACVLVLRRLRDSSQLSIDLNV